MSTESELRALEQQLLQESYEERAELREKIVQQSHKLLEAAESVQSLSVNAKQLLKVLSDIKETVSSPLYLEKAEEDTSSLTAEQKEWLIEMLLTDGHVNTAMLIDMQSSAIGEWLKGHINEDCRKYLRLLAVNTKCSTIDDLIPEDLNLELPSKKLLDILKVLNATKSILVTPDEDCIIPALLNISLQPKTVSLDLHFTDESLNELVKKRESNMASHIVRSIHNCTDNVTLIEVLLRADKEFDCPRPELIDHIHKRMDAIESCQDLLQFVGRIPGKYQAECSDKVLGKLESFYGELSVDPAAFTDSRIRDRILQVQTEEFERGIIQRLKESQNPIEVLFEAEVPSHYTISTTSELWNRIQTTIDEDDLASMRLLLSPFITKSTDLKSPKHNRFDMLPSPDSIPHLPKIPVKRIDKSTKSPQLPSPTSPPPVMGVNAAAAIKQAMDPLLALKKILPY